MSIFHGWLLRRQPCHPTPLTSFVISRAKSRYLCSYASNLKLLLFSHEQRFGRVYLRACGQVAEFAQLARLASERV